MWGMPIGATHYAPLGFAPVDPLRGARAHALCRGRRAVATARTHARYRERIGPACGIALHTQRGAKRVSSIRTDHHEARDGGRAMVSAARFPLRAFALPGICRVGR